VIDAPRPSRAALDRAVFEQLRDRELDRPVTLLIDVQTVLGQAIE
jgi:hypothetical protein